MCSGNILKDFSSLNYKARERILKEILKRGKEKERIITKKCLINIPHYEKKFKKEKTTSKRCGIEKVWVEKNNIIKMYSFID